MARHKAARMGLKVMGTIGVFLLAHKQGHITECQVNGYINTLIDKHNMYLSDEVIDKIARMLT